MAGKNAGSLQGFKRILVAIDGSENASRAANYAVTLAKQFSAELIVCHAIPMPSATFGTIEPKSIYFDKARKNAKSFLNETITLAQSEGVKASEVLAEASSSVVEAIVSNASSHNVDLIIMGTRGQGSFKKLLLGSVSSGVLNHAPCSVLIIR